MFAAPCSWSCTQTGYYSSSEVSGNTCKHFQEKIKVLSSLLNFLISFQVKSSDFTGPECGVQRIPVRRVLQVFSFSCFLLRAGREGHTGSLGGSHGSERKTERCLIHKTRRVPPNEELWSCQLNSWKQEDLFPQAVNEHRWCTERYERKEWGLTETDEGA